MASRIIALIIKEFLALLKDPKSRFVIIGPPVVQLLVFGYAATFDLTNVPFAVYNESPGEASRQLVARFRGSANFNEVVTIRHDDQIVPLIDSKKVLLVVHIGSRFSRDLQTGKTAPVQIILDGRDSNTAMLAMGYVQKIVNDFNVQWTGENDMPGPPARLVVRSWFNPNLLSRWFIVPGIVGLLTLVVTMLVTALSVAREREQGTFDQLLVTPYHPWEILIGKAIPGFIIGTAEATVIILMACLVVSGSLAGEPAGTVYRTFFIFAFSHRRGTDDLIAFGNPAAGVAGGFYVFSSIHYSFRICHPYSQHAAHRSETNAGQSHALLHGNRARSLSGRHALSLAHRPVLAAGRHRYRYPHYRLLAFSPPHVLTNCLKNSKKNSGLWKFSIFS